MTNEETRMQTLDDVAQMVSVQPEATVSRTVMQTEGGNVVLFSFDAGQELSEHTAAMPVFVQPLSGRLLISGGDEEHEAVLLPDASAACDQSARAVGHDADDGHAGARP